ncbi:Radical SAM superfamily enzyme YgiQ, UPF0313 family [Anaerovirgula multivorans]|uniref:Radical SAM superfamily enzyme YgiQ, UPF0313 family n=1 Tax=Anaerovirgula multivorans TaxID=312168 RepID=A0A239KFR4_9FIRM|nr:B12-binding domain-containing radical SAM protein [Anaerovirgula multivorans]SNT17021.1 Radical SAM superfamily enzyme YgiQ, UPF0313 family [Anaerovirgula multivorans]
MKLLLTTLNAKFIHTNLAIRYLRNSINDSDIKIELVEFTINHSQEYIIKEIYKLQPDIVGFSCYIWNIEMIHQISRLLKKIMPDITIIFGGPEVSFEVKPMMELNDAIDIIVMGEGEETFPKLIQSLKNNEDYSEIPSIAFRARGEAFINDDCLPQIEMGRIPFPYGEEKIDQDKIVYYESSRGCPFQCQYCLSSSFQGVRFRPLEMVKKEIKYFIDHEVKQVKFIDRTFNAKKSYAMEIMQYILQHNRGKTNFHFEVTADLIDDDMLEFLLTVPVGLFQFEIGIQSTHEETLHAIQRKMNFERLQKVVNKISRGKNIHQHLDLIVGLPKEDYFTFRKSFNDVFLLKPEKLQIGFLKLLKGSGIRKDARKYGYIYDEYPPYEVLENEAISYGDIIRLKGIEEMVEVYWNSRMFNSSVEVMVEGCYNTPFKFFENLWLYWEEKGYHHQAHGRNKLYEILLDFYQHHSFENIKAFKEILKFDYIKHNKTTTLPMFFQTTHNSIFKDKCHRFLQNTDNVHRYLPQYTDLPAKQIIKKIHFEKFQYNVIEIENNPKTLRDAKEETSIVLFDYKLDNKAIDYCKYFLLENIEF